MKKKLFCSGLLFALFLILSEQPGWAQIPQCLSFQGTVSSALTATRDVTFRIYASETGGSDIWNETKSVRFNRGIFIVLLGETTSLTINFDRPYWIGLTIAPSTTEITPRVPLCASPYALNAKRLYLPFSASVATTPSGFIPAPILFDITQTGAGGAGRFVISNPANNRFVLEATTNGTVAAGLFDNTHANTLASALIGRTQSKADGTARDGGPAGVLGIARDVDSGFYSAGVLGINEGTTLRPGLIFPTRAGVLGIARSGGHGVLGISAEGIGVFGETNSPGGYAGYFVGGRFYVSGNVGIGTFNPNPANVTSWSPVLTIGPSGTNRAAVIELQGNNTSASGGVGALVFRNTASSSPDNRLGQIQVNPDGVTNSGSMAFHTTTTGALTERMRITGNGNIGIGTTTPARILSVAQGSTTDPVADAWTTYSSRRWKMNITPIANALDKVQRLRGVYYDWKATRKHDLGLIAEEVGAVIPEVVQYEANGKDATSVDYARLSALLIEAVKEQQKQIAELQAALKSLAAARPSAAGKNVGGGE